MATTPETSDTPTAEELEWLEVVRQKVAKLRFGSVQITVHDGRVTQVESIEKTRFAPKPRDARESQA
ncbi:MAG: YezD family protein [Verrucomicrobia bacterium]|nr:YezD family protein [Verrucomicrobiota bacterium]